MSITFVGSNTQTRLSDTPISLTLPASNQNDLVLVFTTCQDETKGGPPSTSGYTTISDLTATIGNLRFTASYKFMGATPDTTVSVPGPGTTTPGLATAALVFRGVSTTTPLDVAATTVSPTGGVPNPPAITPTSNDCCIVVAAGAIQFDTSVGSISGYLPSPSVQASVDATGSADVTIAAAYQIMVGGAASAEDPLAWSTWTSAQHHAITIALRVATEISLVTVDSAAVTYTGKSVVQRELVAVSKATVSYAGKTVNIPDSSVDSVFVDKAIVSYAGKTVNAGDVLRAVTVTPAAVLYRGRTVTPRDITFEDIPRYSIKGRGSGHWMETR